MAENQLSIVVTKQELELLKKLDFPCSEKVLASARFDETGEEGYELTGSWNEFDSLVGWVAGEANYARSHRRPRQRDLLDNIADQLECVLAGRRR